MTKCSTALLSKTCWSMLNFGPDRVHIKSVVLLITALSFVWRKFSSPAISMQDSMSSEARRGERLTKIKVLEFYQTVHDECKEEAEKMKEEVKTTAEELSRHPSPQSQRHSALFHNVSTNMASHLTKELESRVYKQLWEEANAAVFRNLATWAASEGIRCFSASSLILTEAVKGATIPWSSVREITQQKRLVRKLAKKTSYF